MDPSISFVVKRNKLKLQSRDKPRKEFHKLKKKAKKHLSRVFLMSQVIFFLLGFFRTIRISCI